MTALLECISAHGITTLCDKPAVIKWIPGPLSDLDVIKITFRFCHSI